jgi:RNA polymerase sigma factor (sigma-70 family)
MSENDQVRVWMPIVRATAARLTSRHHGLDADDLVQEGMIGVLEALRRFRAAHPRLRQVVSVRVASRMRDFVREQGLSWPVRGSRSKTILGQAVSDAPLRSAPDHRANRMIRAVEAKLTTDRLLAACPTRTKTVMELHFGCDYHQREIGEYFGITEGRVNQIVVGTMKKIQVWTLIRFL